LDVSWRSPSNRLRDDEPAHAGRSSPYLFRTPAPGDSALTRIPTFQSNAIRILLDARHHRACQQLGLPAEFRDIVK
jgi:hypothetical protein